MSKLKRLGNVFQSFSQMFFPIGFCLMSDIKLLQPYACVGTSHGNWRIISYLTARLS